MTGFVRLNNGNAVELPAALAWEIERSDGEEQESFLYRFPFRSGWRETLANALRFYAKEDGATVFCGTVDHFSLLLDGGGTVCELRGRGMAGILADNEQPARAAASITGAQLIASYLTPYGISAAYSSLTTLSSFSVAMGTSAWQVVRDYCDFAGFLRPRFQANGALLLTAAREASGKRFTEAQAVKLSIRDCREGIVSKLCRVGKNGTQTFLNERYISDGGMCTQYENAVGKVPAARVIARAMEKRRRVELTLTGSFSAEPSQSVTLELTPFSLSGTFYVAKCRSVLDGGGRLCTLTLYQS